MFKAVGLAFFATGVATMSPFALGGDLPHEQARQLFQWSSFGPQLLTEDELENYRARIRKAATPEARNVIREERYRLMQARAKEKGIALPEKRPVSGQGAGVVFGPDQMTAAGRAAYRRMARSAKTQKALAVRHTDRKMAAPVQEAGASSPQAPAAKGDATGGIMPAIFAPPLMTEEEQKAFRAKLRGAKSQEERERIRAEHRRELHLRAQEKGIVLP